MLRHDCHIVRKTASCEAPGCSAVDCNTHVYFISKVSALFHWRKTSQFIDMQLYSQRSARALRGGFPLCKSGYPGRKIALDCFNAAGSISVSGFFSIREEISRYPGSRPRYSPCSHWSQRWNAHRNKWCRFCNHSATGLVWAALELFLLLQQKPLDAFLLICGHKYQCWRCWLGDTGKIPLLQKLLTSASLWSEPHRSQKGLHAFASLQGLNRPFRG